MKRRPLWGCRHRGGHWAPRRHFLLRVYLGVPSPADSAHFECIFWGPLVEKAITLVLPALTQKGSSGRSIKVHLVLPLRFQMKRQVQNGGGGVYPGPRIHTGSGVQLWSGPRAPASQARCLPSTPPCFRECPPGTRWLAIRPGPTFRELAAAAGGGAGGNGEEEARKLVNTLNQ